MKETIRLVLILKPSNNRSKNWKKVTKNSQIKLSNKRKIGLEKTKKIWVNWDLNYEKDVDLVVDATSN